MGKISDKNTRIALTVPKTLKEELTELAKDQNRSVNNLIVTVLIEHIKQNRVK